MLNKQLWKIGLLLGIFLYRRIRLPKSFELSEEADPLDGYRNFKKIVEILNEECDPEKFIFEYDKFCMLNKKFDSTNLYSSFLRMDGFFSWGNCEESKKILDQINLSDIERENGRIPYYHIVSAEYYSGLACYYLNTDNLEEAKKHLSYLYDVNLGKKQTLDNNILKDLILKKQEQTIAGYNHTLKGIISEIKFKEGDLAESRKGFSELLKIVKHKRQYLHYVFNLALIDIAEKKMDDARIGLKKVIEEGNKLHIVTLAKQELEKLGVME